jgi:hypothetical protein
MEVSAEKISEILQDPESMKNIEELREMLQNGISGEEPDNRASEASGENEGESTSGLFDGIDFSQILQIISLLSDPPKDKNVDFLAALKPLMSEDKQPKIERAVKLLKLYDMYEVLKENGILTGISDLI